MARQVEARKHGLISLNEERFMGAGMFGAMISDLEKQGHREAAHIKDNDVELGVKARRVGMRATNTAVSRFASAC